MQSLSNRVECFRIPIAIGMLALASSPMIAGVDDPRVYRVDLDVPPGQWFNSLAFSGDGTAIAYSGDYHDGGVYLNRGNGWDLVQQLPSENENGAWVTGMSDGGDVIGTWTLGVNIDYSNNSLIDRDGVFSIPSVWDGQAYRYLQVGPISGDGSTVAMHGRTEDGRGVGLLYQDNQVVDITAGYREDSKLTINGLSHDGSVVAGTSWFYGPFNNIDNIGTDKESWVWRDGQITVIPNLDLGYELTSRTAAISGNGEAVIGSGNGIWRNPDYVPGGQELSTIYGDSHAWIWTEAFGTVEIGDSSRFSSVVALDITDNGTTVLGNAIQFDDDLSQYLWTRDGGFVMINDLFDLLGIEILADSYSFYQISGDGTKLMGVSLLDGRASALIVTIPTPSTLMLGVGFGLIAARRRRS